MVCMDVLPQGPRYSLERMADGIQVLIPARKNWFVIIFLSFWLCVWAAGESTAIAQWLGHPFSGKPMPAAFLGGVAAVLDIWRCCGFFDIAMEFGGSRDHYSVLNNAD